MLEIATSQNHGGPRHVTPSPSVSLSSQSDLSQPSGSYAVCGTPTSSIHTLAHPPLQMYDDSMADMSSDVSGNVTPRNALAGGGDVENANQNCFPPVLGPRHSEQPFSQEIRINRELPPFPSSRCPSLGSSTRGQRSGPSSTLTARLLTPPSPELQLLPMAPSRPRAFHRTRTVPGDQEEQEDWEHLSESGSWGSEWEDGEITPPETVGEAEAGAHKLCHPVEPDVGLVKLKLNEGGVRLNENPVSLNEGGVRLNEDPVRLASNPVISQRRRVNLSSEHMDPTYLTPV